MRHTIKIILLFVFVVLYFDSFTNGDGITGFAKGMDKASTEETYTQAYEQSLPPSLQVYHSIKKYCKVYNVPEKYAFKVAYMESGWSGPFQKDYNPYNKISSANALGAMQVLPSTARDVWHDNTITEERLLNDVDFNVHTAIKYMRQLYEGQQDWTSVFAFYNTGYTYVNGYALAVVNQEE
jgi:soluble lytic murein transglycosylase-like protein